MHTRTSRIWHADRDDGDDDLHFEPYVHLAGLTHDSVLLSWGGFFFRPGAQGGTAAAREGAGSDEWMVVDDEDFDEIQPGRRDSIGERSRPYGDAEVEVLDTAGRIVAEQRVGERNHVWIDGLKADTEYRYRIRVDGGAWSAAEHWDWSKGPKGRLGLRRSDRRYDNRFRTHPHPETTAPLTFAVLGDFGIGIRTDRSDARRQQRLARGLERAADRYGVRLVLTVGDNIYLGRDGSGATGDEDDDWFFTFYQPYRYLLNRIPFYPTVGNHDAGESEKSDDRKQLNDNYFLRQRFEDAREVGRSSSDPGLFYTFRYGSDVELVCIDTTRGSDGGPEGEEGDEGGRYFAHPGHRDFLDDAFPTGDERTWRIPFSHHPTYCAGPRHGNTEGMEEHLVPLFRRSGVRLVLAGHEHNFQYSRSGDIHYVVTGAGGKLRDERPDTDGFTRAHTKAWGAEGHFLVVQLERERAVVRALSVDEDGQLRPLRAETPDGQPFHGPIVVRR